MYDIEVINAAMGAQRLTNEKVAALAGVGIPTVSRVRNGDPNVQLSTLKKILDAIGIEVSEVFSKKAA